MSSLILTNHQAGAGNGNLSCFPPSWISHFYTLDAVGEKWVFPAVFHTVEVAGNSLTTLPFPCGIGCFWLVHPCTVLPWERNSVGKVLFSLSNESNSFFFSNRMLLSLLWKAGLLKGSLFCGCLPKSPLSWFSLIPAERGCGQFASFCSFHSPQ